VVQSLNGSSFFVGDAEGSDEVGAMEGSEVGNNEGNAVGSLVGLFEGSRVGARDGAKVGDFDGDVVVGVFEGDVVVGIFEGDVVGMLLGFDVGSSVGRTSHVISYRTQGVRGALTTRDSSHISESCGILQNRSFPPHENHFLCLRYASGTQAPGLLLLYLLSGESPHRIWCDTVVTSQDNPSVSTVNVSPMQDGSPRTSMHCSAGASVGNLVGSWVGLTVVSSVRSSVGSIVRNCVGPSVGVNVGGIVGKAVGVLVVLIWQVQSISEVSEITSWHCLENFTSQLSFFSSAAWTHVCPKLAQYRSHLCSYGLVRTKAWQLLHVTPPSIFGHSEKSAHEIEFVGSELGFFEG